MSPLPDFRPARSLRHPMWLAALVVLVVNDHLLKGSPVPAALTGKLSDFAGPVVAAALLAVLLRVRSRRGWLLSHVAVALGFAAINVSPAIARWVEHVTVRTPVPWRITVDPTDLIGLLALPLSWRVLGRACRETGELGALWRRFGQRVAIGAGALACVATSPAPCDDCEPPPCGDCGSGGTQFGALGVGNDTGVERLVRVRALAETTVVDCDAVLADPSYALPRELFADAETWLVAPDGVLPLLVNGDSCSAYLVETEGLSPRLLVWDNDDFPDAVISVSADAADRAVAVMFEESGRLVLRHENAFRLRTPEPPSTACEIPSSSVGVAWSDPPRGGKIAAIETSPDGCNQIDFEFSRSFVLCMPGPLPFAVGDLIEIDHAVFGDGDRESEIVVATSDDVSFEVGRGSALPPGVASLEASRTCGIQVDACGSSVRPARLAIEAGEPASGGAGTVFSLAGGAELTAVRAQQMPARDLECAPSAVGLDYLEYTLLRPLAN